MCTISTPCSNESFFRNEETTADEARYLTLRCALFQYFSKHTIRTKSSNHTVLVFNFPEQSQLHHCDSAFNDEKAPETHTADSAGTVEQAGCLKRRDRGYSTGKRWTRGSSSTCRRSRPTGSPKDPCRDSSKNITGKTHPATVASNMQLHFFLHNLHIQLG